ncbi:MAG: hypothetical protein O7H41_05545 [Planctomycetota bacterium]|nr:hypothetical protein [Planctomycetota bacterium]
MSQCGLAVEQVPTSGHTLIELTIATGLLTVLFVSLFGAFDTILSMNRLSSDVTCATVDAERVLADLEAIAFSSLRAYTPPTLDHLPDQSTTFEVTEEDGTSIPGADPLPAVVRVGVTIGWKDPRGEQQGLSLYTLRADY